ncbi:MAG: DUF3047 domain-containing protein [Candidatus Omnitrophota bacterium]
MRRPKRLSIVLFHIAVCVFSASLIYAAKLPEWFPFKKKDDLQKWEEKIFKGRVLYSIKVGKADGYLSAYSEGTASGILYRLTFDPIEKPFVSWKWRVIRFPEKARMSTDETNGWVEQDDYAARFYVIFPKLAFLHTKVLEYVWDKDIPEGTIMSSPYLENIKIIVIESGWDNVGKWVSEERNVYEDFEKAFGRKPSKVGAIAIMTDTDNTSSTAEANYDDIRAGYEYGE